MVYCEKDLILGVYDIVIYVLYAMDSFLHRMLGGSLFARLYKLSRGEVRNAPMLRQMHWCGIGSNSQETNFLAESYNSIVP